MGVINFNRILTSAFFLLLGLESLHAKEWKQGGDNDAPNPATPSAICSNLGDDLAEDCTHQESPGGGGGLRSESQMGYDELPPQIYVPFYCPGPQMAVAAPTLDPLTPAKMEVDGQVLSIESSRFLSIDFLDTAQLSEIPVVDFADPQGLSSLHSGWTLCIARIDLTGGFWPGQFSVLREEFLEARVSFHALATVWNSAPGSTRASRLTSTYTDVLNVGGESMENSASPGTQVGTGIDKPGNTTVIPLDVIFNIGILIGSGNENSASVDSKFSRADSGLNSASDFSQRSSQNFAGSAGCQMRSSRNPSQPLWLGIFLLFVFVSRKLRRSAFIKKK